MSGRGGGRDRFRTDHQESRGGGRGGPRPKATPSRHLWVGNLPQSITEDELTHHFLLFGELESVAFQPGRSFAFLNFERDDEAIAAMESLQGFPVAGNQLRIEFTKAPEKSSAPSREEDYSQHRDEQRSAQRGSPLMQRDFRARESSSEQYNQEKSNMSDKNTEPSAVLWIGFPALLKVDEMGLRKAFSPFGEIEKITAFPGRTYAFVRFRSVMSASRAKDALQGKLFGNPRVHICFAKSESGSSNSGRSLINDPATPHFKVNGRSGSAENFRDNRKFGSITGNPSIGSHQYFPDPDASDYEPYSLKRRGNLWTGENNMSEQKSFGEMESEFRPLEDVYDHRGSPKRERYAHLHDYSQRSPLYEEPWELPEDTHSFNQAKKLKTESFRPEKELPEYLMSDYGKERHGFPRSYTDFPPAGSSNRNSEAGPFGHKQATDFPPGERGTLWKESYDNFPASSGALLANPVDRRRFTPESDRPSFNVWKWEGTIAKGGSPVCRARCFPVGKVLEIILPEFLDCTARTGLDMLSKHYYQAASSWVVFFVPESDADIGYYNEFMHYLGEKQRAAVAKLDDRTTLFLVPPSDFSEKVLKVPGKLSISGLILRLENPSSNFGPHHQQHERKDMRLLSFPEDTSYAKPSTPSESISPYTSLPNSSNYIGNSITSAPPSSFSSSAHGVGNGSDFYSESRHEYPHYKGNSTLEPDWSSHHPHNSATGTRNRPTQLSTSDVHPIPQEHRIMQTAVQDSSTAGAIPRMRNSNLSLHEAQYSVSSSMAGTLQPEQLAQLTASLGQQRQSGNGPNPSMIEDFRRRNTMNESEDPSRTSQIYGMHNNQMNSEPSASRSQSSVSSSMAGTLQPQQLAQLAASLLGQQRQPWNGPNPSTMEDFRRRNTMNESEDPSRTPQVYGMHNNQMNSESSSRFGQVQEFQQQVSSLSAAMPHMTQRDLQAGVQGNQQPQSTSTNEAVESDPQKRLQATLQLAAALLQQIQQAKGS